MFEGAVQIRPDDPTAPHTLVATIDVRERSLAWHLRHRRDTHVDLVAAETHTAWRRRHDGPRA